MKYKCTVRAQCKLKLHQDAISPQSQWLTLRKKVQQMLLRTDEDQNLIHAIGEM